LAEAVICPFGRSFNAAHASCVSCQRQALVVCQKPKRQSGPVVLRTWHEGRELLTTAFLYSSNHWHGRPRGVYLAERKKWEGVFTGTWALWGKQGAEKRAVTVRRFVESKAGLIKDQDNKSGAMKPVLDALRKHGVLRDDTEADVSFTVHQEVVPAGSGRVEIEVVKL